MDKIRIGVSKCLLGENVRYDGQHKHDHFITDTLGRFFDFVGVCPEVECGLGVPREAMHLEGDPAAPRLLTTRTRVDHTDQLLAWASRRVDELAKENLCGFIFKAKSPSSGMEKVKVFNKAGGAVGNAPGLFGRVFMEKFPVLPCEDEGRMRDPDLRENFIERVFTLWRFRQAVKERPLLPALMVFHARNKYLIQAHSEAIMRELGRGLARLKPRLAAAHVPLYEAKLMEAMKKIVTTGRHANILQHMSGFFREYMDEDDRHELASVIGDFRKGLIPLIVPVTMIKHYVHKHNIGYLNDQYYLDPHPMELKLRNHA